MQPCQSLLAFSANWVGPVSLAETSPCSAGSTAGSYQVFPSHAGDFASAAYDPATTSSRNEVAWRRAALLNTMQTVSCFDRLFSGLFHTTELSALLMVCSWTLDSALLHCTRTESLIAAPRTRHQPVERTATEAVAPYQESPLGRQTHLAKQSTERVVDMQQVSMWAAT